jgi:POT family proton-dependent oligopeptide transporter
LRPIGLLGDSARNRRHVDARESRLTTLPDTQALSPAPAPERGRDRVFFGHPSGLGWLCVAEFWERFSYYGMQALLVLYMVHALLQPGHVEHVLGFGPFRAVIESAYGPLSPQALASAIFGLYTGLVYLTPIAGGWLAERFIGRTAAVTIGASLMALGHFLMAFEASFLFALLSLLLGVGCFKGNIASQVGDLYRVDDPRRGVAFQFFLLSVQLAVIGTPLVCGTLAAAYGWHWGFAAAGVGMVLGLAIYLRARPALPPDPPRAAATPKAQRPPLDQLQRRNVAILVALVPVLAFAMVGNQQIFNVYLLWAEKSYQLRVFDRQMPVTWILSMSSVVSSLSIIASAAFWRWWATRRPEPDELMKVAIGLVIGSTAQVLLAVNAGMVAASGQKLSLLWAVAFQVVNDIAFANIFPIALALYSRASPQGMAGTLIGVFFLHLFLANMFVGWLGGLFEKMTPGAFWLMHAAIVFGAGMVVLAVRFTAGRTLAPAYAGPVTSQ